jgi:hypothetical protein
MECYVQTNKEILYFHLCIKIAQTQWKHTSDLTNFFKSPQVGACAQASPIPFAAFDFHNATLLLLHK